jgi:hypothetical protein
MGRAVAPKPPFLVQCGALDERALPKLKLFYAKFHVAAAMTPGPPKESAPSPARLQDWNSLALKHALTNAATRIKLSV